MNDTEPAFVPLDRQHINLLVRFYNAEAKRSRDLEQCRDMIGTLTRVDPEPEPQKGFSYSGFSFDEAINQAWMKAYGL